MIEDIKTGVIKIEEIRGRKKITVDVGWETYDVLKNQLEYTDGEEVSVQIKEKAISYIEKANGASEQIMGLFDGVKEVWTYQRTLYKSVFIEWKDVIAFSFKEKVPWENSLAYWVSIWYWADISSNPFNLSRISIYAWSSENQETMEKACNKLADFCREKEWDLRDVKSRDLDFIWKE